MAARPAQSRRVVPEVRGAFQRALKLIDEKKGGGAGTGLTEILVKSFEEDPLRTLDTLAKFCPKEMMLMGDEEHPLNVGGEFVVKFVKTDGS